MSGGLPNDRFALMQYHCNRCGRDWPSYCAEWAAPRNVARGFCSNGMKGGKFNPDFSEMCGSENVDGRIVGYTESLEEATLYLRWGRPVMLG